MHVALGFISFVACSLVNQAETLLARARELRPELSLHKWHKACCGFGQNPAPMLGWTQLCRAQQSSLSLKTPLGSASLGIMPCLKGRLVLLTVIRSMFAHLTLHVSTANSD